MRVAVLGAGFMGSAMAKLARLQGHDVRLWGTWLDDALLEPVERGGEHPRLRLKLEGIALLRSSRLAEAVKGAELVIHAVSSEGAVPVMTKAAPHLPDAPILSVTKGLLDSMALRMDRIDRVLSERMGKPLRFVHAAGPAKAMELARGVFTWMLFAGKDRDAAACAQALEGQHLHVTVSDDLGGAEMCSALKNAYATGLGIWDGHVGKEAHNARAACFTQAIVEMARLTVAGGGRAETVYGPAGIGDLHVTAAAGRNRAFGEKIGQGKPGKDVAAEMAASGNLTEGYPAIATAWRFARERGVTPAELPFLQAIHAIVYEGKDVGTVLGALTVTK